MVLELVTSPSVETALEFVSETSQTILEIIIGSKKFIIGKKSFAELSGYLEKIDPLLKELMKKNICDLESLNDTITILHREVKLAKQLIDECNQRNRVYLLLNARSIYKRLKDITREISHGLSMFSLSSLDISTDIISDIKELSEIMQKAEFKAAVEEEEILEKIELGIEERNVDRAFANSLLFSIAEAVGVSTERSVLRKEFEEFKNEIENMRVRKDLAEAMQMEQIIALLERADATSSPIERETKYLSRRSTLGSQRFEPLHSFLCPITRELMLDPVETSSGHTFDRSSIEKWFDDGNNLCPKTLMPLDTSVLRPNKTLRQSIEEWKERNTIITIALMKERLLCGEEEQVLNCLEKLCSLCNQRDVHREWVVMENYIPVLVGLLGEKNRDIRNLALVVLNILAKDSEDIKERIVEVENAIDLIVGSLGRRVTYKVAVKLLLELSRIDTARECIGLSQGCILLLVTMSGDGESEASRDAKELLENLSFSNQNVIEMAKANFFKPLLQLLSSDSDDVKLIMATTLANIDLTDHNKSTLVEQGVLGSLLNLMSNSDNEMKTLAVKAFRKLSSVPSNGLRMIREGVVIPLLDLLCRHTTQPSLSQEAAVTIMNLAISTTQHTSESHVSLLESDEDMSRLFSLINLRGAAVQQHILGAFHVMCQSPSHFILKDKLMQWSAVQLLIPLCDHDDHSVRANATNLLYCLIEDADEATMSEYASSNSIQTFLKIIKAHENEEEVVSSAMGIISKFPKSTQITEWIEKAGGLPIIYESLSVSRLNEPMKIQLIENTVAAIFHFSNPENQIYQKKAAEIGVIDKLVSLLERGSSLMKKRAALALSEFSANSVMLSQPSPRRNSFLCFSPKPDATCPVHRGICTAESSFCLVEARAVGPLTRVLEDPDFEAREAALDALSTLIEGERLQSGSKVLDQEKAIPVMIKLLVVPSPDLQEKALISLERIFRLLEFKHKYGSSAQMPLVDLTQRGNSRTKPLAAKILAHLNVLHDQSSFF